MADAVLIVGGSNFSIPAVAAARELGLLAIVVDQNPEAPAALMADDRVEESIYDVPAIIQGLHRLDYKGVMTVGHDAEVTVAEVAAAMNLRGISVGAANRCKSKIAMRRAFLDTSVPQTPAYEVTTMAVAYATAVNTLGLPVIVKAVDGCASRGTTIVRKVQQLQAAVEKAREVSSTKTALIEPLLKGTEHSIEILFDGKQCHWLNIVDRYFKVIKGVPIETGHVSPTKLPTTKKIKLFKLAEQAAAAVGVDFGAFKCDCIWTKEGPYVLEVTARLSGGFDSSHTTPMSSGRSTIKAAMKVACGMSLTLDDLEPKWNEYAAAYWPLAGKEQNCADRKEVRLAVADTYKEAKTKAKEGKDVIRIKR